MPGPGQNDYATNVTVLPGCYWYAGHNLVCIMANKNSFIKNLKSASMIIAAAGNLVSCARYYSIINCTFCVIEGGGLPPPSGY